MEISRERIKSLQQQLEESQTVKILEDEKEESPTMSQTESLPQDAASVVMGPPQPVTPPVVVEGIEDAYQQLLSKSTELEEELRRYQEGMKEAKKELEEAKQMNV